MKPVGSATSSRALRAPRVEERRRVKTWVAALMIGLALLFDGIQYLLTYLNVIPVAGTAIAFGGCWFIGILAYSAFYLAWFPILHVSLIKGNRGKLVNLIFSAVVEATPLLDALPGITYGVASTIIYSRIEDAVYNKEQAAAIKKAKQEADQQRIQDARAEASGIADRAAYVREEEEAEEAQTAQLEEADEESV